MLFLHLFFTLRLHLSCSTLKVIRDEQPTYSLLNLNYLLFDSQKRSLLKYQDLNYKHWPSASSLSINICTLCVMLAGVFVRLFFFGAVCQQNLLRLTSSTHILHKIFSPFRRSFGWVWKKVLIRFLIGFQNHWLLKTQRIVLIFSLIYTSRWESSLCSPISFESTFPANFQIDSKYASMWMGFHLALP